MWKYEELKKTLASLYYTQKEIVALLVRAQLSPGDHELEGKAGVVWTLLLKQLEMQGKVKQLVAIADQDYPDNAVFLATLKDQPETVKSPYAGKQPADWKNTSSKDVLEKT